MRNILTKKEILSFRTEQKEVGEEGERNRKVVGKEEEIRRGRIGRLCLSPRAQLRQHHGDRCLHSPQFEQCPAVLGHTVHSFALFRPLSPSFTSLDIPFSLFFSLSPFSSPNHSLAIPGIPWQNERYTSEKDASPFLLFQR